MDTLLAAYDVPDEADEADEAAAAAAGEESGRDASTAGEAKQEEEEGGGGASGSGRLGLCHSCGVAPAKYTCPGCGAASCGVACVKQHKAASGCTGKRAAAAFVPLRQYGDVNLSRDFRFLEDAARAADSAKRRRVGEHRGTPQPQQARPAGGLPRSAHTLRKAALERGVDVLLLPAGMSRRERNTSCANRKGRGVHWRVEFRVVADGGGEDAATLVTERCDDRRALRDALAPHLAPPLPGSGRARDAHKVRHVASAGVHGVRLFLQKEPARADRPQYFALDPDATLCDLLDGKTLVEFPTVVVALPKDAEAFPSA